MKRIIFLFFVLHFFTGLSFSQSTYINPEGSYDLVSKTKKKKGEIYGPFGSISVKRISDNEVFVQIDINRGAPSYNMGMLDGNFEYKNNQVICTTEYDPSCQLILTFTAKGITLVQKADDINMSCGFGHAVVADGFYKKTSNTYTKIDRDY